MYGTEGRPARPVAAVVAAVDIGGTKIDVALADETDTLLGRVRLETRAAEGPEAAISRVAAAVEDLRGTLAEKGRVSAAGLVCAGVVRDDRILLAPNLPGWEGVDLVGCVRNAL